MTIRWMMLTLVLLACSGADGDGEQPPTSMDGAPPAPALRLREVAAGLRNPVDLAAPPGDARLFVVEQPGRIRVIQNGQLQEAPFLDITHKVGSGGERGLLGLAFHPDYARNGYFFVNYTDRSGNTQIERYRVGAQRNRADAASARRILTVDQPYSNHNGGQIAFGPDGMLYIGMGDGGSGGDPQGHGQNPNTLLGAMLRIDVDRGDPYGIPADNPYVGRSGVRPEIWATGLRNPWRFSFDREAGLLFIADVGQNAWEEVHVEPADRGGVNYGWKIMEGAHCFRSDSCSRAGLAMPVLEYDRDDGRSITGGYVYRGSRIPALRGHYLYADYASGWIRSFRYADGKATDRRELDVEKVGNISSFGQGSDGELYVLAHGGKVYRIEPA